MKLPRQFGKYLLLERIAAGGMAELFKAKAGGEQGFEKIVALKRLLPHLAEQEEIVSMFIKEARLAAMLSHSNIVQIYDFGQAENDYYIAMEYVHGKDLKAVIQRLQERGQNMPMDYTVRILAGVAAGLEYAHTLADYSGAPLNLVHRDISPRNILISFTGEVKITDFGIAKVRADDSTTRVGVLKGKVAYMSPEQAAGKDIDRRSDIFSAGVLFYEMLTGQRMFQGETMTVLEKVRIGDYTPPEKAAPGLPPEIVAILKRMLVLDPERRYPTAGKMLQDLEEFQTQLSMRQSAAILSSFMKDLFPDAASAAAGASASLPIDLAAEQKNSADQTIAAPVADEHAQAQQPTGPVSRPAPEHKSGNPMVLVVVMLLILGGVGFGVWKYLLSPQTLADQARAALESGQAAKAASMFENILDTNNLSPEEKSLWAQSLAAMAEQKGQTGPAGAFELLDRAMQLDPSLATPYFVKGKLLHQQKQYPQAVAALRKALEREKTDPDIYFELGLIHAETGRPLQAEKMFLHTISQNPDYMDEAYFHMAVMQHRQNKLRAAIVSLKRAVELNPNNTQAKDYLEVVQAEAQRQSL